MGSPLRTCCCLAFCLSFFLFSACKKETTPATPAVPVTPAGLVLQDRVFVLDTVHYQLASTAAMRAAGTYAFGYTGALPGYRAGDVVLGAQKGGFLRKVSAVSVQGGVVSFQTTQASMEDAFKSGTLSLGADMGGLRRGTGAAWSFSLNGLSVYNNGPLNMTLTSGQIEMSPNWDAKLEFEAGKVKHFFMGTTGGSLAGNFLLAVRAAKAVTLVNQTSTLKHVSKTYIVWAVEVPVVVEMDLDLALEYSAAVDAALARSAAFSTANTFDLWAEYVNKQWKGNNAVASTNTFNLSQRTGEANATIDMALVPKVSFKFYGVGGPYASVGLQEELKGGVASPALDWDFRADVWLHSTVGADVTILGNSLANYSQSWDTPKLTYNAPDHLARTSGDNQTGTANQALAQPIKVQVLDSKGSPQSNVPVYFAAAVGNGTVSPASILSDANGFAQATWTLGASTTTVQHANVTVKTSAGQAIANTPLDFAASVGNLLPCFSDAQLLALTGATPTSSGSKKWQVYSFKPSSGLVQTYNAAVSPCKVAWTFSYSQGSKSIDFQFEPSHGGAVPNVLYCYTQPATGLALLVCSSLSGYTFDFQGPSMRRVQIISLNSAALTMSFDNGDQFVLVPY